MSRKKRELRDKRRELMGKLPKGLLRAAKNASRKEKEVIEIPIPNPGPATFKNGFNLAWSVAWMTLRSPMRLVVFSFLCLLFFFLLRSFVLMTFDSLAFGENSTISSDVRQKLVFGIWEIMGWLIGPMALFPWLAAHPVFKAGFPVTKGFILEPLQRDKQIRHIIGLGLIFVVIMGAFGAIGSLFTPENTIQWYGLLGFSLLGWMFSKITMLASTAYLWRDGLAFWEAFWMGLKAWRYFWKALLGSLLGVLTLSFVSVVVFLVTLGYPLYAAASKSDITMGNPFVGLLLLPIIFLIMMVYFHIQGALGLALIQWGEKPESKEENSSSGKIDV